MSQSVLDILEANIGEFVSGEAIAQAMMMTRANVWKEVQKLKQQNYEIESVRNQGYALMSLNGNLSRKQILDGLHADTISSLEYLPSVNSTNTYAKLLAQDSNINNALIVSDEQTGGRGRMGRSFHSPAKHGIYMSFILRPTLELIDVQLLTIAAAVALVRSIKKRLNVNPTIKWLNDIYIDGRKLAGILTEGEIVLETRQYRFVVLGLGINITHDEHLPKDLSAIYTSLEDASHQTIDRNALITNFINEFYAIYHTIPHNRTTLIQEYTSYSNILGRKITIKDEGDTEYEAIDITENGYLRVRDANNQERILNSGEVSIRGNFK
ncbi:biotin--[acetyl-CoA-carboxylase] ligase [Erysipelothrix sp. HDW6C]|uniref:biotin--[acetyl-CoA-carboxylase] ligase n=1 Tax=Erysipelothrix sp. HDW6C TaxID=2714930 RepID=UPI00140C7FBB|nr:biotin--[acetyl-CoA-carboxylase] ligase [Erysipelothrix sp. HDW6C]QIK69591.1 biotin--[acetyl-CoA-carboxylase] ligase [Erysipelothrix sp. HDW6C]